MFTLAISASITAVLVLVALFLLLGLTRYRIYRAQTYPVPQASAPAAATPTARPTATSKSKFSLGDVLAVAVFVCGVVWIVYIICGVCQIGHESGTAQPSSIVAKPMIIDVPYQPDWKKVEDIKWDKVKAVELPPCKWWHIYTLPPNENAVYVEFCKSWVKAIVVRGGWKTCQVVPAIPDGHLKLASLAGRPIKVMMDYGDGPDPLGLIK